jgi:hypothetical protein
LTSFARVPVSGQNNTQREKNRDKQIKTRETNQETAERQEARKEANAQRSENASTRSDPLSFFWLGSTPAGRFGVSGLEHSILKTF